MVRFILPLMKNALTMMLLTLSTFAGASSAFAVCSMEEMNKDPRSKLPAINLMNITADYYPNEVYHLGYAKNSDGSINSIYYENELGCRKYYSFEILSGQIPIIQTVDGKTTYDLVRVHIEPGDQKGEYEVTMSYMTNGLFRNRDEVEFKLVYSPVKKVYEVLNDDDVRLTEARATTNFWKIGKKKIAVGIYDIICK